MGQLVVVNFVSLDGVMQSVLSADEDRDGGSIRAAGCCRTSTRWSSGS